MEQPIVARSTEASLSQMTMRCLGLAVAVLAVAYAAEDSDGEKGKCSTTMLIRRLSQIFSLFFVHVILFNLLLFYF